MKLRPPWPLALRANGQERGLHQRGAKDTHAHDVRKLCGVHLQGRMARSHDAGTVHERADGLVFQLGGCFLDGAFIAHIHLDYAHAAIGLACDIPKIQRSGWIAHACEDACACRRRLLHKFKTDAAIGARN